MTDQSKNAPVDVLRDGALRATIWRNEGENGVYFTTTLSKTFKKNGDLKDGQSFVGTDLLRIAELARQAYDAIRVRRITGGLSSHQGTEIAATEPEPVS